MKPVVFEFLEPSRTLKNVVEPSVLTLDESQGGFRIGAVRISVVCAFSLRLTNERLQAGQNRRGIDDVPH